RAAVAARAAVTTAATTIPAVPTVPTPVATATHVPASVAALDRRHQRLAAQLHTALVVDADHLHRHLVAHLHHVIDAADVPGVQFGDVAQPVAARRDLDERPELLDRDHLPVVHRPD